MITVGIVDDDPLALAVLAAMVGSRPDDFAVAAAVSSVDQLLAHAAVDSLDVVILDVRLGPGNKLADNAEALATLGVAILAVTSDTARSEIVPALRHRPISILDKDELDGRLHDALRMTASGIVVVTPAVQSRLNAQSTPVIELTPRQQDVLRLRATGLQLKVVARRLGIKYKTAYDHLEEVRRRLRDAGYPIDDDVSLHYAAIKLGYIPDPREGS